MKRSAADTDFFRDMFLFSEVAKQRSFSRAAASLGVSLSLLSRRIAALERGLGQPLLRRTTRKVELTEAGVDYFERCQRLVEEARGVHEQVKDRAGVPRGHLRVSVSSTLGGGLLAPVVAAFAALHPAISIDLDVSSQAAEPSMPLFDLAIRVGSQSDSSFLIHPLARFEYPVYAAPAYLKQRGTPKHPSALAQHECIRLLGPHSPHRDSTWLLSDGKESLEVAVGGRLTLSCMETLSRVVAQGLGIGLVAEPFAREPVRTERLIRILKTWSSAPFQVNAVAPPGMLPAKARVFLEFVRTQLAHAALPSAK